MFRCKGKWIADILELEKPKSTKKKKTEETGDLYFYEIQDSVRIIFDCDRDKCNFLDGDLKAWYTEKVVSKNHRNPLSWFHHHTRAGSVLFKDSEFHKVGTYPVTFSDQFIPAFLFDYFRSWWNSQPQFIGLPILDPRQLMPFRLEQAQKFYQGHLEFGMPYKNELKDLLEDSEDKLFGWCLEGFTLENFFRFLVSDETKCNVFLGVSWEEFLVDYPTYENKITYSKEVIFNFLKYDGPRYDHLITYMNHWLALVIQGSQMLYTFKEYGAHANQDYDRLRFIQMKSMDIKKKFQHFTLPSWEFHRHSKMMDGPGTTKKDILEFWSSHVRHRDFIHSCFIPCRIGADPYQTIDNYYNVSQHKRILNTFHGWNWDLNKVELDLNNPGFQAISYHFYNIICSKNTTILRQFENWLAHIIQRPWEKTQVCWFICGNQGAGKSLFVRMISTMFGTHFSHLMKAENIYGRFNGSHAEAILILIDEGNFSKSSKSELNYLKALISEPTNQKERKGIDQIDIYSFTNVCVCTNDLDPIKMEIGFNRRYQVIEVDSEVANDHNYFKDLLDKCYKDECLAIKIFWKYLLEKKNLEPPQDFTPTLNTIQCQILSLQEVHRWWLECLLYSKIGEAWPASLEADVFLGYYEENAKRKKKLSKVDFIRKLKMLVTVTHVQNSQTYHIPPLDQSREQFLQKMDIKLTWVELERLIENISSLKSEKTEQANNAPSSQVSTVVETAKRAQVKKRKKPEPEIPKCQKRISFQAKHSNTHALLADQTPMISLLASYSSEGDN